MTSTQNLELTPDEGLKPVAEHTIKAHDGWELHVLEFAPEAPPAGLVIAGHAMMVDRRTLCRPDRPTLVSTFVRSGLRVLVPDLRGHGASGPHPSEGGAWTYDDLVDDTRELIELARSLEPSAPLFLVGHSLFGHTSLAFLGMHPDADVDGQVAIGVNIWARRWEQSRARWLIKRTVGAVIGTLVRWNGYFPARRLRIGTADEAGPYWKHFFEGIRLNRWGQPAGVDYHATLPQIRCPVLHVVSDGDRVLGNPDDALAFSEELGEKRTALRLGAACREDVLKGIVPTHMGLVTDPASEPLWEWIAGWIRSRIDENRRSVVGPRDSC